MTEPDPAAEWEPDDEPDTTSDGPPKPDETASVGPPATEPPEAPPGMKYDDNGKLVDATPHSREARYRIALRDAETERDKLKERLETRDKAEVEHLVANRLIDPQDLWHVVSLADVLDPDTGDISPQLVDEAVTRVTKEHPHWRFSPAAPASMVTSTDKPDLDSQQPTWQTVFQQATQPR